LKNQEKLSVFWILALLNNKQHYIYRVHAESGFPGTYDY